MKPMVIMGLPMMTILGILVPPAGVSPLAGVTLRGATALTPTAAQTTATLASGAGLSTTIDFTLPPPPVTDAPVGRSQGGGVRSGCGLDDSTPPLTALVPAYELESSTDNNSTHSTLSDSQTFQLVWSYTTQEYPTFWFYLPYELQGQTEVVFVLQELLKPDVQSDVQPDVQSEAILNTLHVETLYPTTSPGLVSIKMTDAIAPLEVGKDYKWSFQVYCGANLDDPDFVEGWIYKTEPDRALEAQIATATPQEHVRLYAASGIWQDALTTLAQVYQAQEGASSDGQGVLAEWRSLLQSVGLNDFVDYPFSDCCAVDEP